MKKILALLAVLAVTVFASTEAGAAVDVEGRYWFTSLGTKISVTDAGVGGTEVDFTDDLGVDGNKGFLEGRVALELGPHRFRYAYMPMEWSATERIGTTVNFGGRTFAANTTVETNLKADYHRIGYQRDVFDFAGNHVGLILEVKYFDTEASLKSTVFDETESVRAPIPAVGASASFGLPFLFNIEGEITGMTLGSDIYMYDAEAALVLKPAPFVKLAGGYRILKFHVENDDDMAELSLNGPYLMIRADF